MTLENKRKRGRPKKVQCLDELLSIRLTGEVVREMESYALRYGSVSRSAAARLIIMDTLSRGNK